MNYEVMTHANRDTFEIFLKQLPKHKTLHSFEYAAPHVVAVYQWEAPPVVSQKQGDD
jgi:hypothetical protein